jgi:integrase
MSGNITRRGEHSWRLKYEGVVDPVTGKRATRYVTVRGTKKDAQRELIRLLAELQNGTAVDPSTVTIAEHVRSWLAGDNGLSPKTVERYRELAERQIIPWLGATALQKLRPAQVAEWHATLLRRGGVAGDPLSPRTVGHAHRVLHRAFELALRLEQVGRNPVHAVPAPTVERVEPEILTAEQLAAVLDRLDGHALYPIISLALATGMRRGELCALAWGSVDIDRGVVKVERSLEETAGGLRFKAPKTRAGHRSIGVPSATVELLRAHRAAQLELRLRLGQGRPAADDLVFPLWDGSPYPPDKLSRDWGNVVRARKLPTVSFHSLRHSHASALISAGVDIVSVSRRLGHGSPAVTLTVYAHRFHKNDDAAVRAIEAAMRPRK